jgi:hypothetical protein
MITQFGALRKIISTGSSGVIDAIRISTGSAFFYHAVFDIRDHLPVWTCSCDNRGSVAVRQILFSAIVPFPKRIFQIPPDIERTL